ATPGGLIRAGQARAFSGGTGAVLFTFDGTAGDDQVGASVAGPGDLDGDGIPDLLGGALLNAPFSPGPGQVRAHSGANGTPLLTVNGSGPITVFGFSVAGAGDANADGVSDFVVGAPRMDPSGLADAGRATVFSLVGIPPGASAYGSGCAGTGGAVPRISTYGGPPSTGNGGFGFAVSRGLGGAVAFLFLGTAPLVPGFSWGGCDQLLSGLILRVEPPATLGGTAGAGGAGFRLKGVPVPPDASLLGLVVHFHWLILDPGSPNGSFTTSDALSVTVL
ncbi:MAG: integrin alpha, partial [Planctomycetes bacterium]|nr:integrin alpha [Planctomycetota bacterium]